MIAFLMSITISKVAYTILINFFYVCGYGFFEAWTAFQSINIFPKLYFFVKPF
jgi:hypothetical protein